MAGYLFYIHFSKKEWSRVIDIRIYCYVNRSHRSDFYENHLKTKSTRSLATHNTFALLTLTNSY